MIPYNQEKTKGSWNFAAHSIGFFSSVQEVQLPFTQGLWLQSPKV